ncbi:hypothetical protein BRSPCE3_43630 [Bradyrhizobium sp. Ce-3]|nr:hypothetical protein BRSPCE3_43630 [Bradyrhizobium sp. Ce-3]
MAGLDDDPVALDRADQCRAGVLFRVLPFVQGDRHRLDVQAGLDDRVIRKISQPIPVGPAVGKVAQHDGDIDVAVPSGSSP